MKINFIQATLNICAVILLVGLISAPLYFAKNFANVAGVKSQTPYLVVSQVEKFPQMTLGQTGDTFSITFEKYAPTQAYLGVLVLNNPTKETRTYSLQAASGPTAVFFGEDLDNQINRISVPSGASVPLSILAEDDQTVQFTIEAK